MFFYSSDELPVPGSRYQYLLNFIKIFPLLPHERNHLLNYNRKKLHSD